MNPRSSSSGSALLTAMLVIAMVAALSTVALWQLWRHVSVQSLSQHSRQNQWLLVGALDWGRIILREDARLNPIDHGGEPWAMPLQATSLRPFLANPTGAGGTTATPESPESSINPADEVQLAGRITDAQSKFNLHDVAMGQEQAFRTWKKMFALLNLPEAQAEQALVQWSAARNQTPQAPLMPQRLAQLSWLGLPPSTLQRLAPHVVFLPTPAALNLNTATPEVISAVTGVPLAQARRWAIQRQTRPAESVEEVAQFFGSAAAQWPAAQLSVRSQWFDIQGQLIRSDVSLQASGLIRRQDLSVRLQRLQFEPIPASSPAATTAISTIP
ncbi:MAG: hypothetical protein RL307_347 [Pseudomonadota bacterium]